MNNLFFQWGGSAITETYLWDRVYEKTILDSLTTINDYLSGWDNGNVLTRKKHLKFL